MNKKEAKKQRKLERKRAEEKRSKQKKLFGWAIPLILISIVSVSAFGFSGAFSSKSNQLSSNPDYTSIDNEEITPETWRSINLEIKKDDGSIAKIDLLRPLWWIEEAQSEIGSTIPLSMPEMGIEGEAEVINISSCSVDSRNSPKGQRVVTGKFTHENAIVLDLCFNNDPNNSLGVTPNHPIWSQTQGNWVSAGNLSIGEYVKTKDGIAQLAMRSQRPGRHKVYNLEVHKDHNYYVSNLGILVHNSCPTPKSDPKAFTKLKGNQGWKDKAKNFWKKDMKHKDHYDISNSKGKKIREVDFDGNEIWPNGPKNKNKTP